MTKRRIKLFDGELTADKDTRDTLKKVFVNHLLVYNYALEILYNRPDIPFNRYANEVKNYLDETELDPIIKPALLNEVYYQFKKFRSNVKVKKQLTDIQYITYTVSRYSNDQLEVFDNNTKLLLKGIDTTFDLEYPIPDNGNRNFLYFNVSYSSVEDTFKLTVYGSYS